MRGHFAVPELSHGGPPKAGSTGLPDPEILPASCPAEYSWQDPRIGGGHTDRLQQLFIVIIKELSSCPLAHDTIPFSSFPFRGFLMVLMGPFATVMDGRWHY